jgi:Phage portal protein
MPNLWDRMLGRKTAVKPDTLERAYNLGLDAADQTFNFSGNQYFGIPTDVPNRTERIDPSFLGFANGAMKGNAIVFALMRARFSIFSQARFQFRRMSNGRPGDLFGTQDLEPLEVPWTNGTTGDLLNRMIIDADLSGNSYWTLRNGRMCRLRPDWVFILRGQEDDPYGNPDAIESHVIGYIYWPGGPFGSASKDEVELLLPEEVCHFAPIPDPESPWKGMSYLTPLIREIQGDNAATDHRNAFFANGATLQTLFKYDPDLSVDDVRALKNLFEEQHMGIANAYRSLHIGGGVDATVIGTDLKQIDFSTVTGRIETRMAAVGGVPPIIIGLSEGLQAATYSNYGQAKRAYADLTLRFLWENVAGSLAVLLKVPPGAVLWYDDRDIAFLREDRLEKAQIDQAEAATIATLVNSGWTHESARDAVLAGGDWSILISTGLTSVQLQAPSTTRPGDPSAGAGTGDSAIESPPSTGVKVKDDASTGSTGTTAVPVPVPPVNGKTMASTGKAKP